MGDDSCNEDERPTHQVYLDAFYIGKFPVTNSQFHKFLDLTNYNFPGTSSIPDHPVTNVSWFDGVEYCKWLSSLSGYSYRLPTEAEWEYAARSGRAENVFPWGTRNWNEWPELHALFQNGPEPVGSFEPNSFGIHDMGMNVHEWCSDWYDPVYYKNSTAKNPKGPAAGSRRSSRGGSWRHQIKITRCAARSSIPPDFRYADYGFRLVRELD
jgi:formylglycine-generating enzyme required for sulfatase activity